jgi:hypothetical protein
MNRSSRTVITATIAAAAAILGAPLAAQLPATGGQQVASAHAETLETMISLWPKREYYLELASVYERIGAADRELELYETSYAMGWLTETATLLRLAQLRLRAGRIDAVDKLLSDALDIERRRLPVRPDAAPVGPRR